MTTSKPIIFYDIASAAPLKTFAPNPWKTRYALNLKKLPYNTQWVQLPDIPAVRRDLGVPANRTLPNGEPYPTLPMIHDTSTGAKVGDTFEIALYLDKTYPDTPRLIHPGTTGLTAAFNAQVDGLFTRHVLLADTMPFDPAKAHEIEQIFARRMGVTTLPKSTMSPADREKLLVSFENALGEFVKAYYHTGGTTDYFWSPTGTAREQAQLGGREEAGPWLDGEEPTYADLIVGGWLAMMERSMKPDEWDRLRGWQGGFWGRVHDALAPLREIK